ncbi:MAG: hypothetical protein JJ850_11290 [Kordiimonadaceae bacterium]|nr:hypothetical protein [Kordiimonadaceae bacterium]MBO6568829.1 hypothetical protein [Kordiimonadaceae bacterium]MBO6965196.1 hypothetical protein [Kordiimonadaceae bacterium]
MPFTRLKSLFDAARDNAYLRRGAKLLQALFIGLVFYYLTEKVRMIGWSDVLAALPTTPWFYIFVVAMYFAYPLGEWLVYRRLWGEAAHQRFDVFVRMRIYNAAVMSYSGEAYLGIWAAKRVGGRKRDIAAKIKDSQILSALSSNSLTIVLLAMLFSSGKLGIFTGADPSYPTYVAIALGLSLFLIPLVLWFRKQILSLEPGVTRYVFAVHFTRLLVVVALQVGSWAVVLPDVPLEIWLVFLTGQYVLTRVPFLPNVDLMIAGLGLTLLSFVSAPAAALAGIFVASGAINQVLHLSLFTGFTLRDMFRSQKSEIKTDQYVDPVEPAATGSVAD